MLSQESAVQTQQIQFWPIDRLVFYARNPLDEGRRSSLHAVPHSPLLLERPRDARANGEGFPFLET